MVSFLNPWVLALFAPVLLAFLFAIFKRRNFKKQISYFSTSDSIFYKHMRRTRWKFRFLFLLSFLGISALIVAAARPYETKVHVDSTAEGIDIMIAQDVSESMDATDFTPTRIIAAKKVVSQFVESRNHDRLGLVIFAGEALTKSPLTYDYAFLQRQVDSITLRDLKPGTAIGMALASCINRLRKSTSKTKVILLITDGDSNVGAINPITAAHLAKDNNIKIYSIGIGKEDRVVVPVYAYDDNGNRTQLLANVPSYLNPELLKKISDITGGKSYMARSTQALVETIQEIDQLEKTKITLKAQSEQVELFWIPALIGFLILLTIEFLLRTRYSGWIGA